MKCPYCGYKYKEYITYCINCSTEIKHEDYLNSIVVEFNEQYGNINSSNTEFTEIYYENINTKENKDISKEYINKKISTEHFAIKYYEQKGYSAFFSENDYWLLLFLLIYYEDKIWGNNLYSMLLFKSYSKDEHTINNANHKNHDEIFNIDFKNYIVSTYFNRLNSLYEFKKVNEIFNNGKTISDEYYNVSSYLFPIDNLLSSINHLKVEQIKLIFDRMDQDLKYYSKGFPDLIVYNDKEFFLVEVKSKKDNLSTKQKQWLKFLSKIVKIKVKILTIDKSEKQIENIKKQLNNTKKILRKETDSIKTNSHSDKILLNPKTYSFKYHDDDKKYVFLSYDINHSSGKGKTKQCVISFIRKYNEETRKWEPENEIQSFFSLMNVSDETPTKVLKKWDKISEMDIKEFNDMRKSKEYNKKIVPIKKEDIIYDNARKLYSSNIFADLRATKKQLDRNKEARLLEEMNDLDGAIKLYELNVSEKTGSPTTYKRLCKIYENSKDWFRIKEVADIAISIFINLNDKKNTLYFLNLKCRIFRTIEQELHRQYGYSSKYYRFVTVEENDNLYENCGIDDGIKVIHKKIEELENARLGRSLRINYNLDSYN